MKYEIKNDPNLSHLIPIRLAEEQYNIFSLCNLWENVAEELDEIEAFRGIADELERQIDENVEDCFEVIKKALIKNNNRIVLLVDNFGDMLDKFTHIETKELRDVLHGTHLQMITASSRFFEETYRYDNALFDYFNQITLKGLNQKELMTLFESLAKGYRDKNIKQILQKQRSTIEITRRLTGGVPRTMILLFEIFMDENANIFDDLDSTIDHVTPLYKHRMDEFQPKIQKIIHEMALAWDGVTLNEIKRKTRIDQKDLEGIFVKLEKNGLITITPTKGEDVYQLSERFFNIWYLMRYGRKNKKEHILWLVKFLEVWCTPRELVDRAYKHLIRVQEENINPKGAKYMTDALVSSIDNDMLKYQLEIQTKRVLEKSNFDMGEEWVIEDRDFSIEEKIDYYEKAIKVDDKYIGAYHNLGFLYIQKKDFDRTIKFCQKAISINNKDIDSYKILGASFFLRKEYSSAIDYFKKVINLNNKDSSSFYYLGKSYENQKEYDKAIKYYKKAIEVDDKYVDAYKSIGDIYNNDKKEYSKALNFYEKVVKLDSKSAINHRNLGIIYNNNNKYKEAIECYKKAIKLDSKYLDVYNRIGNIYKNQKEYDKAIEYYKKAIEVDDKYDSAYNNMGISYRNKGEYEKAIVSYEKAIEINPKYDSAYYNMGISYDKKGEYDKAIASYKKAIEIYPKNDSAYHNVGISYNNKGEYDKAIVSYKKAIEINPKYDSAYNNMGNSYYNKGEYDKAIEIYPKNDSAYHNVGNSYYNKGEYDKAIASYEKAIEINPKYDSAYYNMGISYDKKGEYDKAIASYEKAIEINPKFDSAYNQLAWLYYSQNMEKEKSLILSEKSVELKRDIHFLHTYATVLLWNGKYDESLKIIDEVLNEHDYLKFMEDMTNYFLLLIAKQQTQSLHQLFQEYPKLKDEFKPVYYTLMYYMQDKYPTEYSRMGAELEETVQEMVDEVGKLAKKYG